MYWLGGGNLYIDIGSFFHNVNKKWITDKQIFNKEILTFNGWVLWIISGKQVVGGPALYSCIHLREGGLGGEPRRRPWAGHECGAYLNIMLPSEDCHPQAWGWFPDSTGLEGCPGACIFYTIYSLLSLLCNCVYYPPLKHLYLSVEYLGQWPSHACLIMKALSALSSLPLPPSYQCALQKMWVREKQWFVGIT